MVMTKQEAADYLGVTLRSIEGYAAKGKLTAGKAKGKRGDIAVFDEDELAKLKAEREQVVYVERPEQQALQMRSSPVDVATVVEQLANAIANVQTARSSNVDVPLIDLAVKHLLKVTEAQRLTGLSEETLREAIKTGALKAKKIGRAFRIKSDDLASYIKKL